MWEEKAADGGEEKLRGRPVTTWLQSKPGLGRGLWSGNDLSEAEWGVWAFIPLHPVIGYRGENGLHDSFQPKAIPRMPPKSLYLLNIYTSQLLNQFAVSYLGILYLSEVWFPLCSHPIPHLVRLWLQVWFYTVTGMRNRMFQTKT